MNRRKGFSLVELLIVLAVMAALIATITPVALNAIKKAKATQVAQNLKTLGSALENAAYVNGVNGTVILNSDNNTVTLSDLGRDIDETKYGVSYAISSGAVTSYVYYVGRDVDDEIVDDSLTSLTTTRPTFTPSSGGDIGITWSGSQDNDLFYAINFTVY